MEKKKKVVRAEEFILVDSEGNERAALRTDGAGNTVVHFMDETRKTRLYVGVTPEGTPRIGMNYAQGKGSIQLEANDKLDSAALIITGATGRAQVMLGISNNGYPGMALFDPEGNLLFSSHNPPRQGGASTQENDDDTPGDAGTSFDWDSILRN